LVFGEVAELYDQLRASYPTALVDDVLALAGLDAAGHRAGDQEVLEVGAGTGKATVLFASRGVRIHALEPSAEMAALARRNCAAYPGVRIEQSDFERWTAAGATFPLLYSAQAWHWVNPARRYVRAREALVEGGILAAFWNRVDWGACELQRELEVAYREAAPGLAFDGPMDPRQSLTPELRGSWEQEIDGAPRFEQPAVDEYRWTRAYGSSEYVALLGTHSDHLMLEASQRRALFAAVERLIEQHGGTVTIPYVTRLCLARAR
jgi:SAM-dependent methyltransferase